MGFGSSSSGGASSNIQQESIAQLILQLISLPGYLFTIYYIDKVGLLSLQQMGFLSIAGFFLILALFTPYLQAVPVVFVMIYGLTFFFQNFGANATTYIIPSVVYSASHKTTCHGISAAAGKLGMA